MMRPVAERFWEKVEKTDTCWIWRGSAGSNNYGMMSVRISPGHSRHLLAHRIAYELTVGPIPEGLTIDHLCRNTLCVNPAHLEAVTFQENISRGNSPQIVNSRKTHCKRGHEFTPENTRVQMYRGRPRRGCKACHAARQNKRYWANPEKYRALQRDYEARKRAA